MRFAHLGRNRRQNEQDEDLAGGETITVPLSELETRSKEIGVFDLVDFLNSRLFKTNGYTFNERNRTISKPFGAARPREEL